MKARVEECSHLTHRWALDLLAIRPDTDSLEAARQGLLDYLACALAAPQQDDVARLLEVFREVPGGTASIIGNAERSSTSTATLVNAYLGHVLDFDDVHRSVRGHPSTVILPALLALAEQRQASGEQLLRAYVIGVEAMGRLGLAIGGEHYERGFHNTATLGGIASAVACGDMLELDSDALGIAIGIAVTQVQGLRCQFGHSAKPLHAGLAARAGLQSAQLASLGFDGTRQGLEDASGLFTVYGSAGSRSERLLRLPDEPLQIVSPGLIFKRYPSCAATHHAAEAALALRPSLDVSAVRTIDIVFPPGGPTPLSRRLPVDKSQGRFSVEYVVAELLLTGRLDNDAFIAGHIDNDRQALMARMQVRVDPRAEAISDNPHARFTELRISLDDGHILTHRVGQLPPVDPTAKLLATLGDTALTRRLLRHVQRLGDTASLQALMSLLRGAAETRPDREDIR